jgi:hypothetical protein
LYQNKSTLIIFLYGGITYFGVIYHGPGKPGDVNQFLFSFKKEVADLCRHGIQYKDKTVYISISGISCDSPETAFY